MVALRMEPDPNEPLPFAVGEIIRKMESKIVVCWFGQTRQNESTLDVEDTICQPFLPTNRNKIPPSVLRDISRNDTVDWVLPSETINTLYVQTTQQ